MLIIINYQLVRFQVANKKAFIRFIRLLTTDPSYLEKLRISEGRGDFPVLGEAAVGVGLADLVHLARQLREQLHPHHAMLGLTLLSETKMKKKLREPSIQLTRI